MTNKSNMRKGTSFIILLSFLFSGCKYDTEEVTNNTKIILPNGKHLVVEKTTTETTSTGIITKYNYGTSHRFKYKLLLSKEDISWDGGSGEPKNILFCNDNTYIRYLEKKSIRTEYIDSITNETKSSYHSEISEAFQKHIDNRYFFNLLGSDFWIDITSEDYSSLKKSCKDYIIPNENELTLEPAAND